MIPDIVPVNTWPGNGSTTTFDFDFLINSTSELKVLHTNSSGVQTTLQLNVDYVINQDGVTSGDTLTFPMDGASITFPIEGSTYSTLADGEKISLLLDIPIAQTTPYGTSSKLNFKAIEYSFDYLTRLIQMISRVVQRAIKFPEGTTNIDTEQLAANLDKIAEISDDISTVAETITSGLSNYQPKLVSGTNIKTINNNTILGSGNLDIDSLPSQTGNAGKVLSTNGTTASWINNPSSFKMRQVIQSTTPQEDAGLHLADGALLQYGSYKAFIDDTAEYVHKNTLYAYVYNDGTDDHIIYTKTTTLASDTTLYNADKTVYTGSDFEVVESSGTYEIQYSSNVCTYTAADNILPSEFITEVNWQAVVTLSGVCDKFVYDSVNNTVRLPKYGNQIFTKSPTGTIPVKGNGISTGWIDGENEFSLTRYTGSNGQGYAPIGSALGTSGSIAIVRRAFGVTTDGTKSGIVADISSITNYPLDCYYYIVIATTTKTSIEVDIDEIATDLNGKADVDLTNVTNTSGFRKLVEVYNNGASWYKVFREYNPSDGTLVGLWCEQGGAYTSQINNSVTTINLLKTYSDTNYNIIVSANASSTTGDKAVCTKESSKTTSSFVAGSSGIWGSGFYWRTCGYIV